MQQSDLKQQSAFAKWEQTCFSLSLITLEGMEPEEGVHVSDRSAQVDMKLEHLFDHKKKRISFQVTVKNGD